MTQLPLFLLLSFSSLAYARPGANKHKQEAASTQQPAEGSIWDSIEAAPPADADAAPTAPADAETAQDSGGDAYPTPAEGNLWDYVEGGSNDPDDTVHAEIVEESAELREARRMEESFLTRVRVAPPTEFYQDPIKVLEFDPLHLDKVNAADFDIPIDVNEDVIRWLKYFTGNGRKYYAKWMGRSTVFRPMMYEKLRAAGLPEDLVYLSMVESGYSSNAYSSAAAAGLWQFIPSTGRLYDLRVDSWVDERRDPEAATDAAIAFLGDLYKEFGDWRLVWAAYNGGPGRVTRGQERHGTKDFWELVAKNAFASETDNYVPKIMAAAIIGHNPERYGFTDINFQPMLSRDTVRIDQGMFGLDVLAEAAGVSVDELREMNPHLRQFAIPPEGTFVHVPKGTGEAFAANVAAIPPEKRLSFQEHRVAKGETLGTIARKYGVSVSDLQRANHIKNPNQISVGTRLVIPGAGASAAALAKAEAPAERSSSAESASKSTAKSSSSSTSAKSSGKSSSSKSLVNSAGAGSKTPKTALTWHTVKKGENLSAIATRYGVTTSDLMRWNGMSNANHVEAGQKLKVYTPASEWTTVTVRSGDTLSTIAGRYGCSVSDLKTWNKLGGSTIYAGQKLKVQKK